MLRGDRCRARGRERRSATRVEPRVVERVELDAGG